MPIESKECFAALTEDGQLWEIYQAAQTGGGGGITSINGDTTAAQLISGTAPITASTAAGTTTISTSMNTARLLGRTTAGVGVAEEITVGTGLSLAGGTLTNTVTAGVTSVTGTSPIASSGGATPAISIADAAADGTTKGAAAFNANDFDSASGVISLDYTNGQSASASNKGFLTSADWTTFNNKTGGSVGAVDNAVLRADVGTGIVQNSNIVIDDVATATQDNVAIVNASSATNSSLVLTPKGTGALIAGPKPDGTATGGNARGSKAICLVGDRSAATQVASGANSVAIGYRPTAAGTQSIAISAQADGGNNCIAIGQRAQGNQSISIGIDGNNSNASGDRSICIGGQFTNASGQFAVSIIGGGAQATPTGAYSGIFAGHTARSDRYAMISHAAGAFAANGDAQRARFVLRCKTTTNAAVEMALDGSTTYLSIPNNKVIFMNIKIVGARSTGAEIATYERQYAVKNVALTSSQVYAPITIGTDNAAGTVLDLSVVDAAGSGTDYVSIKVTGIASQTWRWVASVDAVEVELGT